MNSLEQDDTLRLKNGVKKNLKGTDAVIKSDDAAAVAKSFRPNPFSSVFEAYRRRREAVVLFVRMRGLCRPLRVVLVMPWIEPAKPMSPMTSKHLVRILTGRSVYTNALEGKRPRILFQEIKSLLYLIEGFFIQ